MPGNKKFCLMMLHPLRVLVTILILLSGNVASAAQGGSGLSVSSAAIAAYSGSGGVLSSAPVGLTERAITNVPKQEASKLNKADDAGNHPQPPQLATDERNVNEFQSFIKQSIGQELPIFGADLFKGGVSTFAPVDNVPVTPDYLIGPGDEIVVNGWGTIDIDFSGEVNRDGEINLPKVGSISVVGVRYQDLQKYLKHAIGKVFRNFELNVTLGKLRSIQVYVVGQARHPGLYTVSSLSTLVNTLFATGGPSANGSLRQIEVKRNGKIVTQLDMYDFLLKGDKSKDIPMQSGDILYIPPVGAQVAIYGGVKKAAIFELRDVRSKLAEIIDLAGGLDTTAAGQKVMLERIEDRKVRKVEEVEFDQAGLEKELKDGDLIQVFSIGARFENAVTLRGNVAAPGRYPWKEGIRISDLLPSKEALIVAEYWKQQNAAAQSIKQLSQLQLKTEDDKLLKEDAILNEVKHGVAEINWDYAVVERLDKNTLATKLLTFNLGKAISGDAKENILLLPGDTITIFSKNDIQVPLAQRSVYVKLEGEIKSAGVYKTLPGETLRQLLTRVGGFTANAYFYGTEFNRESVRVMQQKKMTEMIDRMEQSIRRNAANQQKKAMTADEVASNKAQVEEQLAVLEKMRGVKASGRIVLEILPDVRVDVDVIPDLVLEDGDRLFVPARPNVVNVMGMVYNENSFMYRRGKYVSEYLEQAGGPTREADTNRVYLVRADGSVLSAQNECWLFFFCSVNDKKVLPGDTIVVPEELDHIVWSKELKDWTQILYQFALGVASFKVIRGY